MTLLSDHEMFPNTRRGIGANPRPESGHRTKSIALVGSLAHDRVTRIKLGRDGKITVRVSVRAPGGLDVLITAWKDTHHRMEGQHCRARLLNPAPGRFVVARAHRQAKPNSILILHPRPSARRPLKKSHFARVRRVVPGRIVSGLSGRGRRQSCAVERLR